MTTSNMYIWKQFKLETYAAKYLEGLFTQWIFFAHNLHEIHMFSALKKTHEL